MSTGSVHRGFALLRRPVIEALRSNSTQSRNATHNAVARFLSWKAHVSISCSHLALTGKSVAESHRRECVPFNLKRSHDSIRSRGLSSESFLKGVMSEEWPEHEFSAVAEASLEAISEVISDLGFNSNKSPEDFDVELSQGVLTVSLGENGTYVLNTQTPNRQIWLSSPSSGPWRYGWNPDSSQWISTRDGHSLAERLSKEFGAIFDGNVSFSFSMMHS